MPGLVALGLLFVVYAALAALPAAPGSKLVLATQHGGGSPHWLLGPLRFAGLHAAGGRLGGPLFYVGLWLALLLYLVVLARFADVPPRVAVGAIVGLHALFLLAPPLLSQDVFSYIAYARLGVTHGLDPYTHSPLAIPHDAVFPFAGSRNAKSVYGPAFTLLTYPLAPLGVPAAFWILKTAAAAASLGVVALVWKSAERLGRDPLLPALFVGLNPAVLVHVVGGAHNEALVVLAIGLLALIGFGTHALDALGFLSSNQGRTSRWSLPYKTAQLLGAVLPGSRLDYRSAVRAVYAVAFAAFAAWALWRTWRGADPIRMAAWTTFAILLASAWLVPWYLLWLLPLAALAADRRLLACSVVLTAWTLVIAVPL